MKFPEAIQNVINLFKRLPGIGPKSAERLVFELLRKEPHFIEDFTNGLYKLKKDIQYCRTCHNICQINPCLICQNPKRNRSKVCVVTKPQDLLVIENSNNFDGLYHVLWGNLSAIEGITPDQLKITELINRIKSENIKEIILAFNTDMEGESTIMYLNQIFQPYNLKTSRLARGLPMGTEIEYADDITISNALEGRISI